MRRAVASFALVSFLATGYGETLLVAGGGMTMVGTMAAAIPDDSGGGGEDSGCNDGPGCVDYNLEPPSIDETAWLLTGVAMMLVGGFIVAENRRHEAEVERLARHTHTREPITCAECPMAAAEPPP